MKKTNKKYYTFQFTGGNDSCTTGQANEITGRYSIAGSIHVFDTKKEAIDDVDYKTVYCTKAQLRKYQLGSTVEEFENDIELF